MRVTVPQQRQPYVASRKFNVFINFFVRDVYLRAFGDDERESHAPAARSSAFEDYALGSGHEQFVDRAHLCRSLLFQFPIKGSRNIHVVRTESGFIGRSFLCHKYGRQATCSEPNYENFTSRVHPQVPAFGNCGG
jgi:hypothetical protein